MWNQLLQVQVLSDTLHIADSPSGKAEDSDSSIRWFESIIGN